jgi:hypothetical protein
VYCQLALVNVRHRRIRAALSALLIALSLIPVLLAVGLCHRPEAAPSPSTPPEGATFRPLFMRFASAFLVACAAITFLSSSAKVRPRKYEIGVLRFLGASKLLVVAIVSTEAAVVSLAGALIAVAISQIVLSGLNSITAAAQPYSIGVPWCLAASSIVVGAAIGGSAIPCAFSVQHDVLQLLERDR